MCTRTAHHCILPHSYHFFNNFFVLCHSQQLVFIQRHLTMQMSSFVYIYIIGLGKAIVKFYLHFLIFLYCITLNNLSFEK